jgi:hypothetical protein
MPNNTAHPPPWQLQTLYFNLDVQKSILPLKSGLTPLDKAQFTTAAEQIHYDELSGYQRNRFNGRSQAIDMVDAGIKSCGLAGNSSFFTFGKNLSF